MNWPFATFALVSQSVIAMNALIFQVYTAAPQCAWIIHILFTIITIVEIVIGYVIGKYVRNHFTKGRLVRFAEYCSGKLRKVSGTGKWANYLALFILANFSYPYVNAFIAAWFGLSFGESLLFLAIGNLTGYILYWAFVTGVIHAVPSTPIALCIIIGAPVLLVLYRWLPKLPIFKK